jgi:hypothetical protein
MSETRTRFLNRVLTDMVYENPVDAFQERARRRRIIILVVAAIAIAVILWWK